MISKTPTRERHRMFLAQKDVEEMVKRYELGSYEKVIYFSQKQIEEMILQNISNNKPN